MDNDKKEWEDIDESTFEYVDDEDDFEPFAENELEDPESEIEEAAPEENQIQDLPEDEGGTNLNILEDANFVVKCQVGEANLSFREISKLKVGDTIEFIKWPSQVKLHLNNLVFAAGYLVEMDGMLGVKITNIGNKDS